MPSAVWWEWWPTPTVPVPMARRLVWMPVLPKVTISAAPNLRERAGRAKARQGNAVEWSHAAPAAQAVRWRNSRRFMGPPRGSVSRLVVYYIDAWEIELVIRYAVSIGALRGNEVSLNRSRRNLIVQELQADAGHFV